MADVALQIDGRVYTVSCRDGEEAHLRDIAQLVDRKAVDARHAVGGVNETRQLLFAALLLADELVESQRAAVAPPPAPPASDLSAAYPLLGEALERLAERIEDLTDRLEREGAAP